MKYCEFNGCGNKIARGGYCAEHKRKRRKPKKVTSIYHSENKSFYNSDAWKAKRSLIYEREKGLCQRCKRFVFGRKAHVHHIVPIKKNPNLKLDENNLRLLCDVCDAIEENEDKRKVFPAYFD